MDEFKKRFTQITELRQSRHNVMKKLEMLDKQKVILALEIESMQKELVEEKHDVDKLERVTWSSIVNTLLNSKLQKLEEEKHDLYVAQLKYSDTKDEYNRVIREYEILKAELQSYDTVEHEYQHLLDDMTQNIVEKEPYEAVKLAELLEQRYLFEKERISLNEALKEGEEVLKKLNEAKRYLVKAKDWGEYDLSGGGLVATMKKYHYLDEAQELLHRVSWGLRKFHNSLEPVGLTGDDEVKKFLNVSDYWIDGIFIDYALQSAIIKLVDFINNIIVEVLGIDEKLRKELANSAQKKSAIDGAMDHFFERMSKEKQ